jgi:hypothetical protein
MIDPRTTHVFEDDNIVAEFPHTVGLAVIARLQHAPGDVKSLPAQFDHLRHEWESIEAALAVESAQDLLWRPYFDEITGAKPCCCLIHLEFLCHRLYLSPQISEHALTRG